MASPAACMRMCLSVRVCAFMSAARAFPHRCCLALPRALLSSLPLPPSAGMALAIPVWLFGSGRGRRVLRDGRRVDTPLAAVFSDAVKEDLLRARCAG
eukprot:5412935-Alexandrium_andersonii.AAC.1